MEDKKNTYRFLARIVVETKTPLNIGSGNKNIKTDSLILRDVNGLPFIPGTTIAGLLRHSLSKEQRESLMGSRKFGSRLIITEAKLMDENGKVLDGLLSENELNTKFLSHFRKQMTIRQHVKINHRGTAEKAGKFDEEVVIKGARFCFELEMLSNDRKENTVFKTLLNHLASPAFRIGSGSRSGFGEIAVTECKYKMIDLSNEGDRHMYLNKPASLSEPFPQGIDLRPTGVAKGWTCYTLTLQPEDFLLFGSGFGDKDGWADMTYVREKYVDWSSGTGIAKKRDKVMLIPGTSVKGAISHRTAYYYNKVKGNFADLLPDGKSIADFVGKNNPAVVALFGSEGVKVNGQMEGKQRGNVLISDFIEEKKLSSKFLNHVSIDRFTGGAIDGALFTEEVLYAKGQSVKISLLVNNQAFQGDNGNIIREAFEYALDDICTGLLPLGGGVNRGNGCFKGEWTKKDLTDKEETK